MPNLKKLGLLDAADGWLRQKFTEMGAIAFENVTDSTEDEDAFADGSPADRQVAWQSPRPQGPPGEMPVVSRCGVLTPSGATGSVSLL